MSALREATRALHDLEADLATAKPGELDLALLATRVRAVLDLLAREERQWLGTTEAKRLLGVGSENTVKAWARLGLLRSRVLPNGRTQVLLDDVLHQRAATENLTAIGGDDLTADELHVMHDARPGVTPWERDAADAGR
jgi:hypothetical protein